MNSHVIETIAVIVLLVDHFVGSVIVLNGEWSLKDETGRYVDLRAEVPGGIYTDLMQNNIIGDVFYGYNDTATKWVPRANWTYYRNFTVDNEALNYQNINLVLEGLDTYSEIILNNQSVGTSNNMFVRYILDVKEHLKPGLNNLEVRFLSPVYQSALFAARQSESYPIPQECPPNIYNGECHVNMLRKMQASFAWDWGPSLPSVGIWKDVYLEYYNESLIRYVTVDTVDDESDSTWVLNVTTYLANNRRNVSKGQLTVEVLLVFVNVTEIVPVDLSANSLGEVIIHKILKIPKGYVNTWWPNGYGAHDLYTLSVTFTDEAQTETSYTSLRIGFRTVELIQDKLDSGLTFYFKINHVPIFMKGSNAIPVSLLPEKGQDKGTVAKLLNAVHDSHMNMLRVWGGGVYESDYFYELANELGILIWQDFMFACSMYPANDEFLSTVRHEVNHQVKRLGRYTNIALFSGNNENEGFLAGNVFNTNSNYTLYKDDYVKLYVDTIKEEFQRLTGGGKIFVTSSPTNGLESDSEGYVAKEPSSQFYGDVHYYNYILNPFDSNVYPVPRFASEYGYQSLPSKRSVLTATQNESDLYLDSEFMVHRQHHPIGNAEMLLLVAYQFDLPNVTDEGYPERVIFYSQIIHAMSTKIQTEHYRRYRSSLDDRGRGFTMGALYWQLNDVWIAPTWAGIDFVGNWKMLQYFAQEFFSPIIVTGHMDVKRNLNVYVVSDLMSPLENVTVSIQVFRWDSFEAISTENITLNLDPGTSHLVRSFNVDDHLANLSCGSLSEARNNCFLYFSLGKGDVRIAPDNFLLPAQIRESKLEKTKVEVVSVKKISDEDVYKIELSSDFIALFVWLETEGLNGKFSENGFLMISESMEVYFYAESTINSDELEEKLKLNYVSPE